MRSRLGSALTGLILVVGAAGEARAAGTVEITGGFTLVQADAGVNCPPQGSAGDGEAAERRAGVEELIEEDFDEGVTASATAEDLPEDCGVRASAGADQRTSVSAAADSLAVSSSGSATGNGTGEPTDDGDFAVERFNGFSRVSIGFTVAGGPVGFSMSGSHTGTRMPGSFSEGIAAGPRPEDRSGLPEGFAITGVLPPGDYSVSASAQCTHVPALANGTTTCPEAEYSFTLLVGGAADVDGDALPNLWEEDGADTDGDGEVDLAIDQMGSRGASRRPTCSSRSGRAAPARAPTAPSPRQSRRAR